MGRAGQRVEELAGDQYREDKWGETALFEKRIYVASTLLLVSWVSETATSDGPWCHHATQNNFKRCMLLSDRSMTVLPGCGSLDVLRYLTIDSEKKHCNTVQCWRNIRACSTKVQDTWRHNEYRSAGPDYYSNKQLRFQKICLGSYQENHKNELEFAPCHITDWLWLQIWKMYFTISLLWEPGEISAFKSVEWGIFPHWHPDFTVYVWTAVKPL